jgi:hypothetical protein
LKTAYLGLREGLPYRREAFRAGLESLGYTVRECITLKPESGDLLCLWNRYGEKDLAALAFEAAGLPVLIAENGYLGNEFAGKQWFALSRNQHNGAGTFSEGGPERWDSLGVTLQPWRESGETVLLPQRGIGPPGVAMPRDWLERTQKRLGGASYRVRVHPGTRSCMPLEDDLADAGRVITWGSGAALKALTWGIPVESDMPRWIGACENTDAGRLAMFRRLVHGMATLEEIADGSAFRRLL